MDDIKRAARKRFERDLREAGWEASIQGEAFDKVAFWVYSVSPSQGVRVISQLSVEGYRAACEKRVLPKTPGLEPWDELCSFLRAYDGIQDNAARAELSNELTVALLHYASHTNTWPALPKLGQTSGIHLIVTDWCTAAGVRVMRLVALKSPKVLTMEDLARAFEFTLEMHLSKNPSETPVLN
jgi:hypothetical protein